MLEIYFLKIYVYNKNIKNKAKFNLHLYFDIWTKNTEQQFV